MDNEFIPLGLQSPQQIAARLAEIEGEEVEYGPGKLSFRAESAARTWLNTQHQYGYIAPFSPGKARFHPIQAASNIAADAELKGKRINIRLDALRIYEYPKSRFNLGENQHTILFSFEARNQVEDGREELAVFNQLYKARSGQDAAVIGQPIFIGLTVGPNGIGFVCRTVNVMNSSDEELVSFLNSDTINAGLKLLTTAQPALSPLTTLASSLCNSLASHSKNVPVQEVRMGLDFETGATGARLAVGSYIVAQTTRSDEITWSEWVYDAETGAITSAPHSLAAGEKPSPLPHNAFVFRVSPYTA